MLAERTRREKFLDLRCMNYGCYQQILSLGERARGVCICVVDENGELKKNPYGVPIIDPLCPAPGHSKSVHRVQFSNDGAHVVSSSSSEHTVRIWDADSGELLRKFEGNIFALVEGPSDERNTIRHILIGRDDRLLIYQVAKAQQHAEDAAAVPVACFKGRCGFSRRILCVRSHGALICVGHCDGEVSILSAPFLAA